MDGMFPVYTGINRLPNILEESIKHVPCTHRDFSFMEDFANFCQKVSDYAYVSV